MKDSIIKFTLVLTSLLFYTCSNDGRIVYGWGGAVGTYFRVDPTQNLAYVMMIQLSPYRQLNLRETFQNLVNEAMIN